MDRVNNFYVKDLLIFSIKKQVLYSPSQSSKRTKINFEREKYSFYAEAENFTWIHKRLELIKKNKSLKLCGSDFMFYNNLEINSKVFIKQLLFHQKQKKGLVKYGIESQLIS